MEPRRTAQPTLAEIGKRCFAPAKFQVCDRLPQRFTRAAKRLLGACSKDDRKFVAADACDRIPRVDGAFERLREKDQQTVAFRVALSIVDDLEVIDVHVCQRVELAVVAELAELGQYVLDAASIRQARKSIVHGNVFELGGVAPRFRERS